MINPRKQPKHLDMALQSHPLDLPIKLAEAGILERYSVKLIGASLQAHPVLHVADAGDRELLASIDMAEISITSCFELSADAAPADAFRLPEIPGAAVTVNLADGAKCARCWRVLDEVGSEPTHPELCHRCTDTVEAAG